MNKKIIKANRLTGEVTPPPSKSILHRYIIASSLAKGISKIENISYSDDIIATIEAMEKLGAKIEKKDNYLLIDGSKTFDKKYLSNKAEIDCNELLFNPFILIFEPIEFATKKKAICE